jgi:hypothetical protein
MPPLTHEEARRLSSWASMTLCNLMGAARFYFIPGSRRLIARSVASLKPHAIPPDAMLVGCYMHGIAARRILEDLDDLLASPPPEQLPHAGIPAARREHHVPDDFPPIARTYWPPPPRQP